MAEEALTSTGAEGLSKMKPKFIDYVKFIGQLAIITLIILAIVGAIFIIILPAAPR